jgi:hypothetical protein
MKIAAEWSEIPTVRRHAYFYLVLLLCALGANVMRQNARAMEQALAGSRPTNQKLDRIMALENASASQPIFTADLSLQNP